jgi:hypothetical protein
MMYYKQHMKKKKARKKRFNFWHGLNLVTVKISLLHLSSPPPQKKLVK